MEHEFWHSCWQNNHLGFQLAEPHPMLVSALPELLALNDSAASCRIFVPLCGKSPDLHFLAERFHVVGCELSAIACADFFVEANVSPEQVLVGEHVVYQNDEIALWQGDFFRLPESAVSGISVIYDRAALIALPKDMRIRYVQQLKTLFPSATMLLISLAYPEEEKSGPPFNVTETEIRQLFAGASFVKLLEHDLTGVGFAKRRFATSSLIETAWLIRW